MSYTILESDDETIVACATPPGVGALAIVRLSGPHAFSIASQLNVENKLPQVARRLTRVTLIDHAGALLDEALWVIMRAPHSATGEDVVEFHLHGAQTVVGRVLNTCLKNGARMAGPGEFTRRGFLRGKLDLTQAEAVHAMIVSESQAASIASAQLLGGALGRAVSPYINALSGLTARWRALTDFPDDVAFDPYSQSEQQALMHLEKDLAALIDRTFILKSQGLTVALAGAPNVGKSSLLNAWAKEDCALVDAEAGTTRDVVSASCIWQGQSVLVWDTAGERLDATGLEARGIRAGRRKLRDASLVVWLVSAPDFLFPSFETKKEIGDRLRIVLSRTDLLGDEVEQNIRELCAKEGFLFLGGVTSFSEESVTALAARLCQSLHGERSTSARLAILERHATHLIEAQAALAEASQNMRQKAPLDLLLFALERAHQNLGFVVGRDVDADALDLIFANFCIGK